MKYYLLLILFFCLGIQFSHAGLLPVDQQQKKKKTKQSKKSSAQKIYKLEQTLKKTYSLKKRQKLEQRIKKIKTDQTNRKLGITAFALACVGAFFFLFASVISVVNLLDCSFGWCGFIDYAPAIIAITIVVVLLTMAILIAAMALQNHRENPEVYGGRRLAKIGLFLAMGFLIAFLLILSIVFATAL